MSQSVESRYEEWRKRTYRDLRQWTIRAYFDALNYARSVGFPLRRIRRAQRSVQISVMIGAVLLFSILVLIPLFRGWVIGESGVFANPENQGTWFIEFLLLIVAGIILHFVLRETGPPQPSLKFDSWGNYIRKSDNVRLFSVLIRNRGDTSAIDCVAELEMNGIEKADIISPKRTPSPSTFTSFTVEETSINRSLCWGMSAKKKIHLRSGEKADLLVARWEPPTKRKAARFEIVGSTGWKSTSIVLSSTPGHYYGVLRMNPFNGKEYRASFVLRNDKLAGPVIDFG